jgi:microcystin-dependent protein
VAEPIGKIYETAVPSLSDTANIQDALRIYHYGRPPGTDPATQYNTQNETLSILPEKSIAFYLNSFQTQINSVSSAIAPESYAKKGNIVSADFDGPRVLELSPDIGVTAPNGLLLTSDDSTPTGLKWQAPDITLTNIQTIANKIFANSTIATSGLKFLESGSLPNFTTTLRSPDQSSNKTVIFPTTDAELPGSSTTLVGTDTIQTLTNKTLTSAAVTNGGSVVGTTATQTLTNKTITNLAASSTIQDGGTVVGTTATQTLTNKTLTSASVTGGGSVVGTTATQTLTNKTISLEPANNTITGILPVANGATPAGVISQYAGTAAPAGYLLCQGQSVSTTTFAALFAAIGYNYGGSGGSFNLPNLQNRVPVGRGSGTFGSLNATGGAETVTLTVNQMPSHTHIQNSHNHTQDAHSHGASSGDAGSHGHTASTDTAGGHTHGLSGGHRHESFLGIFAGRTVNTATINSQASTTSVINKADTTETSHLHTSAGGHAHTVTIGDGGSHSHTVSVNNATATNQPFTATNQNTGGGGSHNNLQPYIVVNYIIKT